MQSTTNTQLQLEKEDLPFTADGQLELEEDLEFTANTQLQLKEDLKLAVNTQLEEEHLSVPLELDDSHFTANTYL